MGLERLVNNRVRRRGQRVSGRGRIRVRVSGRGRGSRRCGRGRRHWVIGESVHSRRLVRRRHDVFDELVAFAVEFRQ